MSRSAAFHIPPLGVNTHSLCGYRGFFCVPVSQNDQRAGWPTYPLNKDDFIATRSLATRRFVVWWGRLRAESESHVKNRRHAPVGTAVSLVGAVSCPKWQVMPLSRSDWYLVVEIMNNSCLLLVRSNHNTSHFNVFSYCVPLFKLSHFIWRWIRISWANRKIYMQ